MNVGIGRAVHRRGRSAPRRPQVLADRGDPPPALARVRSTGTTAAAAAPGCGARRRTPTAARRASPASSPSNSPAAARTRRPAGRTRGTAAPGSRRASVSAQPSRRRTRDGRARRARGRTRGPATGRGRRPARVRSSSSRSRRSAWPAARIRWREVGIRLDRVRPVGDRPPRAPGRRRGRSRRAPARARRATSRWNSLRFGRTPSAAARVPIAPGHVVEVVGGQHQQIAAASSRAVSRIPPLRWALATHRDRPAVATLRGVDDVARPQPGHRRATIRSSRPRRRRADLVAASRRYSQMSPNGLSRRRASRRRGCVRTPLEPGLECARRRGPPGTGRTTG